MRTLIRSLVLAGLGLLCFAGATAAQDAAPKPGPVPFKSAGPLIPLKVQIVITRYQGDKKVSSLPYELAVNANDGAIDPMGRYSSYNIARLRMGAQVPVATLAAPKDSPVQGPMGPVTYKDVGTNIDCYAYSIEGGRFSVNVSIEDSSVYSDGQTAQGAPKLNDIPSFRSFKSNSTLLLKDGQSTEFTAAADKISGEVTKIDVTVAVVK